MNRDERTTGSPRAAEVDPPRTIDPSADDPRSEELAAEEPSIAEELDETQEAQRAHGGSMAPEWVDATGRPKERSAAE